MTEYKFDAELLEYIQTFQSRIEYVKWDLMCNKEFASRRGWEEYNLLDVSANIEDTYMFENDENIHITIRNDDYTRILDRITVTVPVSALMGELEELDTWLIEYAKGCE